MSPVEISEVEILPAPTLVSTTNRKNFSEMSYAVVDVETTGLYPKTDRIIEIAILSVQNGVVEDRFCTLLNPRRDIGDTNIHGITTREVLDAPLFEHVAGEIAERLKNRYIVGHNVRFDLNFLRHEFDRIGITIPFLPSCCTMQLAYHYGPDKRKLTDCCKHYKISRVNEHAALDDAEATFSLLKAYFEVAKETDYEGWNSSHKSSHAACNWPTLTRSSGKVLLRRGMPQAKHNFLSNLVSRLPASGGVELDEYYSLLDRALEDRHLSQNEISALSDFAVESGLSAPAVIASHREYLRQLVRAALSDDVLTPLEQKDIEDVAFLLGFDKAYADELIDEIRKLPPALIKDGEDAQSLVGKKVCFTGALIGRMDGIPIKRETALRMIREKGLIATDSVTKTTDILIVADPDTMSGKAEKAREYGIQILAEIVFWKKLGIEVE